MIRQLNTELNITHEYKDRFHSDEEFQSYVHTRLARELSTFLFKENAVVLKTKDISITQHIRIRGTIYVATEEEYWRQERGPKKPTDEYERGVIDTLTRVMDTAEELQGHRLQKNQHAAAILTEFAMEAEEELLK